MEPLPQNASNNISKHQQKETTLIWKTNGYINKHQNDGNALPVVNFSNENIIFTK